MKQGHVFLLQVLFVSGITYGSQSIDFDNKHKWPVIIARYVISFITIKGSSELCAIVYKLFHTKTSINITKMINENKNYGWILVVAVLIMFYSEQKIFVEDFALIFIAYLVVKYPEVETSKPAITYGSGMACSYFEGYLVLIIPSNGAQFVGFEENISIFENNNGVIFPVKKLFIIITKNLYCPPDLKEFNKSTRHDLPQIEACKSMEELCRDVAGVKSRVYRNSAYKLSRPRAPPVYLAAECATPLHTLHRARQNRAMADVLADIDVDQEVEDFCTTLRTVLDESPECQGRCELVFFDNTDPSQNLADVLLKKIAELEPDFERIIRSSETLRE